MIKQYNEMLNIHIKGRFLYFGMHHNFDELSSKLLESTYKRELISFTKKCKSKIYIRKVVLQGIF